MRDGLFQMNALEIGARASPIRRFVQAYGVDAYSLAVPALVWARSRSVGSL